MSNQNQYGTERALGRLASTIHRRLTMANLWLIGCLGVAAFLAIRSFVTTQTESPTSVRTEAVSANSGTIERAIEDFRVGDRMAPVENPAEEFDDSLGLEVDPATWRKLTLKATKDDGTCCDIDLLRPNWWIEEESAEVGGKVYVSVPECGIESFAEVLAIEACPPIQPGRGPVVTGTFAHQSADVINIHVEGLDKPIGTTTNHPFWSDTREEFVAAGELHPGERLHGIKGNPRITKILPRGPPEPVYNLEVFGEHVYQVSSSGLLVHNGGACSVQPRNALGQFVSKTRPGQASPGASAVDDFARQAEKNGFDVIGREISVTTPFGQRRYDLVMRNRNTSLVTGVEIKSSPSAFKRFDEAARQQFAADRWLRQEGGLEAIGKAKGVFIDDAIKVLWTVP